MQQTSNYNLNLPEGTDVVNPLVDYNPNFTVIDGAMKANADRTVGRATCIKSGTTHVVTRSNPDSPIINFTATGDWNVGDTMTVDGTIVSVYLPDGSAPLTGAYVINTEVVAVVNGSRVTLYGAQKLPGYTASDISYDNTASGLAATDVQDAIDALSINVNSKVSRNNIEAVAAVNVPANSSVIVALPDGFTHTNAFVISHWATISNGRYCGEFSAAFILENDTVRLDNKSNTAYSIGALLYRTV